MVHLQPFTQIRVSSGSDEKKKKNMDGDMVKWIRQGSRPSIVPQFVRKEGISGTIELNTIKMKAMNES